MRFEPPAPVRESNSAFMLSSLLPHPTSHPRFSPTIGPGEPGRSAHDRAERRLLAHVSRRCHAPIAEACRLSSVPPEFLAALTALESGGDPKAVRFEPAVYRHLRSLADGDSPAYSDIGSEAFAAEIEDMLHPKAGVFHAQHLTPDFSAAHRQQLAALDDEILRELASSWGFTQIMGYQMVGRRGTVRNLPDPAFHYHVALQLLAEFAHDYQLDLTCEFEELFRCWNTGRPYGSTADPDYVEKGLRLMELCRSLWLEEPPVADAEFQPAAEN